MSPGGTSSRSAQEIIRQWAPRLALVAFIALLIYVVVGKEGGIIRVFELKKENDQLQATIQRLENERDELQDQIQRLQKSDPKVIEEEARRKGMVKQGETVYRIQYKEVPDTSLSGQKNDRQGEP